MRDAISDAAPKPARQLFEAIVHVRERAANGRALTKKRFASASTIHNRFLEWEVAGIFASIWRAGLAEYDQMASIAWRWQSIDRTMFKGRWRWRQSGPTRQIGRNKGSKCHLLVDGGEVPLSLVVTGANQHDVTQLEQVLSAIMVKRKTPSKRRSKLYG